MITLLAFTLMAHVFLGVVGLIGSYLTLMYLLKRAVPLRALKIASAVSCLSYVLSWLAGGYYYVVHYGDVVKPIIKAGEYAWGHLVMMEAKEHVFLFLPVVTFSLMLIFLLSGEELTEKPRLKKSLILLASVVTALATVVTISGVLVSGAAR